MRPPDDREETAATLDEVGVAMGPDHDGLGLFDAPTTGTATGEHTAGAHREERVQEGARRTAVLAWIAAELPPLDPVADGPPCTALKRLIADEPLDPLPALDGVPPRPRGPARVARAQPLGLGAEREDTATQIEGFEAMLDRRGEHGANPQDPDTAETPRPAGAGDAPTQASPARVIPARDPRRGPTPRGILLVALALAALALLLLQAARATGG